MTIHAQIYGETTADAPPELAETHFKAALSALETTQADTAQGWTPQRQAQFLEAIADGATVAEAAEEVRLSPPLGLCLAPSRGRGGVRAWLAGGGTARA